MTSTGIQAFFFLRIAWHLWDTARVSIRFHLCTALVLGTHPQSQTFGCPMPWVGHWPVMQLVPGPTWGGWGVIPAAGCPWVTPVSCERPTCVTACCPCLPQACMAQPGWEHCNAKGSVTLGMAAFWPQGMVTSPAPWTNAMPSWIIGLHVISTALLSRHPGSSGVMAR